MKIAVFDTHPYDHDALVTANSSFGHELVFFEPRLSATTAVLADGCPAVCSFVNDRIDRATLTHLRDHGTRIIALRSAGFNHVDVPAAKELGFTVVRVPEYSPQAVAEHAVALLQSLNRKIHRAYARVRDANFSLDGLVGIDLYRKTIGVVGTGRIGAAFCRIMRGFGCELLAYDPRPNPDLTRETGVEFVELDELYRRSRVISLHVPLTPQTRHLIDARAISQMRNDVILINTSRGGLIDTPALIDALKSHRIAAAGLDVYEEEEGVFFEDLSGAGLQDDVLARLLTFPNVLITSHQAFLTHEALANIAETTLSSVHWLERGEAVPPERLVTTA